MKPLGSGRRLQRNCSAQRRVRAAPVVRENEQYLPYLQQQFEDAGGVNQARQGWDVLRWELEFVRLFNLLHFNARDFDVDGALKGLRGSDPRRFPNQPS